MAKSKNTAFQGLQSDTTGRTAWIVYLDAAALVSAGWNFGIPRGHFARRKAGWYWWPGVAAHCIAPVGEQAYGPFTSSRLAYQSMMTDGGRRPAAKRRA